MERTEPPRTVVVIGAGTIGLGWTMLFLAHGMRVRLNSRRADVEESVGEALRTFGQALPLPDGTDPLSLLALLEVQPSLEEALRGADVLQENIPDDLELKQELYERVHGAADPSTLLLSSTSKFSPDDLGKRMGDPRRLVVGHPFNPPHLIPLVEVVGGERTEPTAVQEAMEFYRAVGRVPVHIRRAVPAFVANRLQSALLRESIHLVREGVVTVTELDTIVTQSIGLRWSTIGPFHAFHLGGGPGGLRQWLTHLGTGLERGWAGLGQPPMGPDTVDLLVQQTDEAYGHATYEELAADRDRKHLAVLRALDDGERPSADEAGPGNDR
ncbi:3-hydroxyacyl-CoA dehydrogenase NAD-binding domain-containing protein [Nocardiopsis halotolerans]|uniref:3-hydroxyacyl-CoA dehydrogenase NAD-binding domain-containing protein n=1 Tax=Nocardiopsis halotolerans TaxID=124252 RepID=UPI00034B83EB|nr:3-hydroxyacyl-CoA dehydrogenase NAD-binding domain-containing protein [Nocardiopsis halotolerans]